MTDNRNRTAPEVRKLFEVHGGKLGPTNCVAYLFERKGLFVFATEDADEEQLMEVALEAGANDIVQSEGLWEVTCEPADYLELRKAIEIADIPMESSQVTMVPTSQVACDVTLGEKMLRMIESFEDHDDVQNVYSNADIPEEAMEA